MEIITVAQNKEKWGVLKKGQYTEYDPEEVHTFFCDVISGVICDDDTIVYIRNLDCYYIDIIRVIEKLGLVDRTRDINLKKVTGDEYRYLVSDDGKCFAIDVGELLKIRNFEQLIPIKSDSELTGCYLTKYGGLEGVTRSMYEAIVDIQWITRAEDKIPLTISSLALDYWKNQHNKYDFYASFRDAAKIKVFDTTLEDYIRPSYHGGWCMLNYMKPREYKDVKGVTLDVTSLYPYVMKNRALPFGKPYTWEGEIPEKMERLAMRGHAYFFVKIKARFTLKDGHFPCIQIANNFLYHDWIDTTDINDGFIEQTPEMVLTQTDYYLLLEHYDIYELKVISGVYFKASSHLFDGFIDTFYTMKQRAKTSGQRKIAKMILNSLSGSTAKRRQRVNVILNVDKKGDSVCEDFVNVPIKAASYIYLGAAITSYARKYIIEFAHKYKEHFIYCDTDSLHLDCPLSELDVPISDKIGDFKVEMEWTEAVFFAKKIYAERNGGSVSFKCAGLDREISEMVSNMMANKPAKRPEEFSKEEYARLKARMYMGLQALKTQEIPYYERVYENFTYTAKYHKMKLKFTKKQKKTIKLV